MDFVDARDLDEAFATLDELGDDVTVLAGGTDVMVQYLSGEIAPKTLLHVRRLKELTGIAVDGRTELGGLTTHWELRQDSHIVEEYPGLEEAAATVGGRQTQNVGTVAGNVVNASPAADLLPPLLVADAQVLMRTSDEQRTMPLSEFLVDRKQTALRANELVTGISLERPGPRTADVYLKVGRRGAMEVAIVGLSVRLSFDEDGAVSDARVAVCSVAPKAYRAEAAEASLVGSRLEDQVVSDAGRLLQESARPIDDVRATAAYRTRVLGPLLGQAVVACRSRAEL